MTEVSGAEILIDFIPEAGKNCGTLYYITEKVFREEQENVTMADIQKELLESPASQI